MRQETPAPPVLPSRIHLSLDNSPEQLEERKERGRGNRTPSVNRACLRPEQHAERIVFVPWVKSCPSLQGRRLTVRGCSASFIFSTQSTLRQEGH